jgi:tetratricopeptide (TPR) repeat protein
MADDVGVQELIDRAEELELGDRGEEALAAWAEVAECCTEDNAAVRAYALARRVWLLAMQLRRAEAIAAADQLSSELADGDAELAPHLAFALYWRARCLGDLGRVDEALQAFGDLTAYFGADAGPEVRRTVIPAHLHAAALLEQAGRPSEAIDAYDEALVALPDAPSDAFSRDWTISALRGKAALLESMGREDEAVLVLDAAVGRLHEPAGIPDGPAILLGVLEQEGRLLLGLGRFEDALEVCDQAVALARSHPEIPGGAVIAVLDQLIESFEDEGREPVAEAVRRARELREELERQPDEDDPEAPDDPEDPDDPDDEPR